MRIVARPAFAALPALAALAALATGCITSPGLYVDKTGPGDGTVVSDTPGIDCGGDCGGLVDGPITLTATPTKSSLFGAWSGIDGCDTDPVCSFDVTTDRTVEARFDRFYPTLTVTPIERGVVHARGIECGTDCTESYDFSTFVTLSVVADPGWIVAGWTDPECTTTTACAFTITEDITIAPILAPVGTLQVDIVGTGHVASNPMGINCGSQCVAKFPTDATVTLNATPQNVTWSGCTVGAVASTCTVMTSGFAHVTATFN